MFGQGLNRVSPWVWEVSVRLSEGTGLEVFRPDGAARGSTVV